MGVYEEMGEYCDLIYCDTIDVDFYLREARNAKGKVLEIACGTGRIMIPMISGSIDASGIDISPDMLRILRGKSKKIGIEPKIFEADMRDFSLADRFQLIIVPNRSFLHLADDSQREKALRNFFDHLAKGGRLIIHNYIPSDQDRSATEGYALLETESMRAPDGREYTLEWFLHFEKGEDTGRYRIVLRFKDGVPHIFEMDIHYISERDMKELLKRTGFKNIKSYCGFNYHPYNPDCREVLLIAEK